MWLLAIILDSTVLDLFCLPIHNMVVLCVLVCVYHKWSHTICVGLQLFFLIQWCILESYPCYYIKI